MKVPRRTEGQQGNPGRASRWRLQLARAAFVNAPLLLLLTIRDRWTELHLRKWMTTQAAGVCYGRR